MAELAGELRRALAGKYPLIYLLSAEEERLAATVAATLDAATPLHDWTCVSGLGPGAGPETQDPVVAIQAAITAPGPGCWLLRDLPEFFAQPRVLRALRDAYQALAGSGKLIVMTSPRLVMPQLLEKEIFLITVAPPSKDELAALVLRYRSEHPDALAADIAAELPNALRGMTLREAEHILNRVVTMATRDRAAVLDEVYAEKEMTIRKTGFLEFVPPRQRIEDIGGLETLKDWLVKRRHLFSAQALEDGLPVPRGMLIMGVSGCGKSLTAKVVSSLWDVPLFRLDMNLIFSGLYGSPEAAFSKALAIVESVAPVVLWVDEIENGIATASDTDGGQTHIFSAFLTWMQEKPPLIFIAATANRIQDLPAEILRKGRFDQVFFVDLPTEAERRSIFDIHLRRNGVDPAAVNVEYLVLDSEGWNGAEIEQAVISARIDAQTEGRETTSKDLMRNTSGMVPLSETMREQIKALRDWAYKRATLASTTAKRPS